MGPNQAGTPGPNQAVTTNHYTNLALTLATVLHGTATTVQEVISITSTTIGNYRTPTDTQHRTAQHPGADTLAQTNALHGRTVLPHRDDYDHALNPDHGHTITEQQLTDALTDATRTHRTDPAALTTRAEQLYHHAITLAEHGHTLPDDHTADLTAALTTSLAARDHITTLAIRAATTDQAAATINALTQLAHNTPNPHATPTLTILALTAYRTGNGALANTALNRALTHHPHYPLAQLTHTLIQNAINPQTLDHLTNAQ